MNCSSFQGYDKIQSLLLFAIVIEADSDYETNKETYNCDALAEHESAKENLVPLCNALCHLHAACTAYLRTSSTTFDSSYASTKTLFQKSKQLFQRALVDSDFVFVDAIWKSFLQVANDEKNKYLDDKISQDAYKFALIFARSIFDMIPSCLKYYDDGFFTKEIEMVLGDVDYKDMERWLRDEIFVIKRYGMTNDSSNVTEPNSFDADSDTLSCSSYDNELVDEEYNQVVVFDKEKNHQNPFRNNPDLHAQGGTKHEETKDEGNQLVLFDPYAKTSANKSTNDFINNYSLISEMNNYQIAPCSRGTKAENGPHLQAIKAEDSENNSINSLQLYSASKVSEESDNQLVPLRSVTEEENDKHPQPIKANVSDHQLVLLGATSYDSRHLPAIKANDSDNDINNSLHLYQFDDVVKENTNQLVTFNAAKYDSRNDLVIKENEDNKHLVPLENLKQDSQYLHLMEADDNSDNNKVLVPLKDPERDGRHLPAIKADENSNSMQNNLQILSKNYFLEETSNQLALLNTNKRDFCLQSQTTETYSNHNLLVPMSSVKHDASNQEKNLHDKNSSIVISHTNRIAGADILSNIDMHPTTAEGDKEVVPTEVENARLKLDSHQAGVDNGHFNNNEVDQLVIAFDPHSIVNKDSHLLGKQASPGQNDNLNRRTTQRNTPSLPPLTSSNLLKSAGNRDNSPSGITDKNRDSRASSVAESDVLAPLQNEQHRIFSDIPRNYDSYEKRIEAKQKGATTIPIRSLSYRSESSGSILANDEAARIERRIAAKTAGHYVGDPRTMTKYAMVRGTLSSNKSESSKSSSVSTLSKGRGMATFYKSDQQRSYSSNDDESVDKKPKGVSNSINSNSDGEFKDDECSITSKDDSIKLTGHFRRMSQQSSCSSFKSGDTAKLEQKINAIWKKRGSKQAPPVMSPEHQVTQLTADSNVRASTSGTEEVAGLGTSMANYTSDNSLAAPSNNRRRSRMFRIPSISGSIQQQRTSSSDQVDSEGTSATTALLDRNEDGVPSQGESRVQPLRENSGIVVATAVESETIDNADEAIMFDPKSKRRRVNKKMQLWTGCALLSSITVAAVLGLVYTKQNQANITSTPEPTPPPTTSHYWTIKKQIEAAFGQEKPYSDMSSPYGKALYWLTSSDSYTFTVTEELNDSDFNAGRSNFSVDGEAKYLQDISTRYFLALFYYQMSGDQWVNCSASVLNPTNSSCSFFNRDLDLVSGKSNWLSSKHVCEWAGISCNDGNEEEALSVERIELSKFTYIALNNSQSKTSILNMQFSPLYRQIRFARINTDRG